MGMMAAKRRVASKRQRGSTPKTKSAKKPATIDAYLAAAPPPHRAALEHVRKTISAAVPRAEEGISYKMPAFRLDGRWFIWFGAAAKHCAIYGVSSDDADLSAYDTSGRGTLRFPPDAPPPASLVRKLVKARLAKR